MIYVQCNTHSYTDFTRYFSSLLHFLLFPFYAFLSLTHLLELIQYYNQNVFTHCPRFLLLRVVRKADYGRASLRIDEFSVCLDISRLGANT